jgi:DNA-directed RNA polymerase subunit N
MGVEFKKRVDSGEEAGKVMDDLGRERYCCRACFLGHAEMLPEVTKFKKS